MVQPLVLLHVSDLHVSTYGDSFHDRARIVKRSDEPLDVEARLPEGRPSAGEARYERLWAEGGWRVLRDLGGRKPVLVLVDPTDYAHPIPSQGAKDPCERAAARMRFLDSRRAQVLAHALPRPEAVATLLAESPRNTNLLLLKAAQSVQGADVVLVTGDLTDDGDGHELVASALGARCAPGHLLAIPGNHDLYLFPLAGSGRPAATHERKRTAWRAFAAGLGLELDDSGVWVRTFPASETIIVGLDSCAARQRRFYRQTGSIGPAQLSVLRQIAAGADWQGARHRIVALHHHVVPLPHGVGRRAPTEIGMRLDDAREVATVLNEIDATFVLHGHRHISEARQPAGCRFRLLAAPSLTLGCKSGDPPSFWRLELDHRADAQRVYLS